MSRDFLFQGVKSYPRGVTTNSEGGIESYTAYYPIFEAMEQEDMVLNLHGEVPSDVNTVRLRFANSSPHPDRPPPAYRIHV
jgi:dihydroorotase